MVRGINKPVEGGLRHIVGRNVKAAREYAGFNQRELCDMANLGQAYLSQCETGKWNIGVDNIERIANALGIQPHELLNPDFEPASFNRVRPRRR